MTVRILVGDARQHLAAMPAASVHCCVTSPPYWSMRDYGHPAQIGLEPEPELYLAALVGVFREVRRVLRPDGTLWLNLGGGGNAEFTRPALAGGQFPEVQPSRRRGALDAWALKPKDLIGMPWRVAAALQADGWYLRADVIWSKPNPTPESCSDRPTKSHEYVFLLSRSERYFYDQDAIREPHTDARSSKHGRSAMHAQAALRPRGNLESNERWYNPAGRNKRSVWSIPTEPFGDGHFAVMPTELAKLCMLAGTSERGACAECGAPLERDVERTRTVDGVPAELGAARTMSKASPSRAQGVGHGRIATAVETRGWRRTCAHHGDVRPCVVLDPFAGAGTVGLVATSLGRHATLIELNPEYAELARRRTAQEGLFAAGRTP